MGHSILLVEDDSFIGGGLREVLVDEGYDTVWVRDGAAALDAVDGNRFDLMLLDLGLPDMDGVTVCREVRQRGPLVVVVITARDEEMDVVLGFDAGADDYVVKPFRSAELLARLRAHFRRPPSADPRKGLRLDHRAQRAFYDGNEVALRPREFELLAFFVDHAGTVVSRDQIMAGLWAGASAESKTLDMHMSTIRRKLEKAGAQNPITTIRGVGYRLEAA